MTEHLLRIHVMEWSVLRELLMPLEFFLVSLVIVVIMMLPVLAFTVVSLLMLWLVIITMV